MSEQSSTIQISLEGQRFYQGVAAGSKVRKAWDPEFDKANADAATRSRIYWFYVGLVAAHEYSVDGETAVETFLSGASTRAPGDGEADLPDDWPEEFTEEQQDALDNLVHDVASRSASSVNNDGPDSQLRFLLANGWTVADVLHRLGLDA